MCAHVASARWVSTLTDDRPDRISRTHRAMQRNATRCERAVRPRGSWNLGGSRVRLTAPRICHLAGHLALERSGLAAGGGSAEEGARHLSWKA